MAVIPPYLGWSGGSTAVGGSVGAGRGDARNERASGKIGTSPTDLRLGLLEVEKRLGTPDALDFAFTGDASWARISTADGTETIDRQGVSVHQLRLGADLSLPAHIGAAVVTPFGAVYARRDGGAGQIGEGVEVAGGLRVVFGFVRLDGEARMLVQHSAEGYEERGAAVSLSLGRRQSEEGFSLAISPRWGDPTHATGAILRDPLRVMPRHRPTAPNRWSMDARANYAVRLPGNLRMDLTGSYGGVFGGPGFGLRIGTSGGDPPAIRPDSPTGC